MVQQLAVFPPMTPVQQETQAKSAPQKNPADSFSSLLGAKQTELPAAEKPRTETAEEPVSSLPEDQPDKATVSNAIALSMSGLAAQFATQQTVDASAQEQQTNAVFAVSGAELAQGADPISPEEAEMVLEPVLPQETFSDVQNVQKAAPVQPGTQPLPQNPQEPASQPITSDASVRQPVFEQSSSASGAFAVTDSTEASLLDAPAEKAPAIAVEAPVPAAPQDAPSPVKLSQGETGDSLPAQQPPTLSGIPAQEASVLEQPAVQSFVQKEMPADFRRSRLTPVRPTTVETRAGFGDSNAAVQDSATAEQLSAQNPSARPSFAEQFIQTEEPLPAQQQPVVAADSTPVVNETLAQETAVSVAAREVQLPAQKQDSAATDLGSGSELAAAQITPSIPYHDGNVIIPVTQEAVPMPQAQPAQQLAEQIQQNIDTGRKEFTMDLYPHDLGRVSVKLVSESGVLTVEIAAANPKTQSLLLSGASEIKSILQAEQPVQVVDASQNKQGYEEQQRQQSGQNAQEQAQQQEQEQQKNRQRYESSFSTGDFLLVMQQLRAQAV